MEDAVKVTLAKQQSPYGVLLLAIVERAVADIRAWMQRRKRKARLSVETFNHLLERAQHADDWLRECVDSRLTLRDVCDWHGLDSATIQAQIYEQFDGAALAHMRKCRKQVSLTTQQAMAANV